MRLPAVGAGFSTRNRDVQRYALPDCGVLAARRWPPAAPTDPFPHNAGWVVQVSLVSSPATLLSAPVVRSVPYVIGDEQRASNPQTVLMIGTQRYFPSLEDVMP
jgi:hypothetical protein